MFGSLMMLASGSRVSAPSSARASPIALGRLQVLREVGDDASGQGDVARLDFHARRRGVGLE